VEPYTAAAAGNVLLGYGGRRTSHGLMLIMPVVVSIALFLIADIENPSLGVIRVQPQNMMALAESLKPH